MPSKLSAFLAELKRRKVYRAAAVYVFVGLGILGASELILEPLQLGAVRPYIVVLVLLGFPLALALAWAYELTPDGLTRSTTPLSDPGTGTRDTAGKAPASVPELSIAVLPFANMSAEPDTEYFSDGISEELLTALARTPGLRVAARTSSFSFKGRDAGIPEIGAALHVAHILEGSVRRAGDRVRITAQLVSSSDGYHIWSESYDRQLGDILVLQTEIAAQITQALEVGLRQGWHRDVLKPGPVDVGAYDLYLRGRFELRHPTRESLEEALRCFRSAVELDPQSALPHAGIANALAVLADAHAAPAEILDDAIAASQRAIELDPNLAEAHAQLATIRLNFEWKWGEAKAALDRALALNPNLAEAHWIAAFYCWAMGDSAGAVQFGEAAFELDPLSPSISVFLEWFYWVNSQFDDVIRQHVVTEKLSPGFAYVDSVLGLSLLEQGLYDEALRAFQEAEPALGHQSIGKAIALARMGRTEQAVSVAEQLEAESGRIHLIPEWMAQLHVVLGQEDRAYEWLERGISERSGGVIALRVFRYLRPLHGKPRFRQILARVGLDAV